MQQNSMIMLYKTLLKKARTSKFDLHALTHKSVYELTSPRKFNHIIYRLIKIQKSIQYLSIGKQKKIYLAIIWSDNNLNVFMSLLDKFKVGKKDKAKVIKEYDKLNDII